MQDSKGPVGQHPSEEAVVHRERQSYEDGHDPFRKTISPATPRCVAICTVGELFGGVERHVLGLMNGTRGTRGKHTARSVPRR